MEREFATKYLWRTAARWWWFLVLASAFALIVSYADWQTPFASIPWWTPVFRYPVLRFPIGSATVTVLFAYAEVAASTEQPKQFTDVFMFAGVTPFFLLFALPDDGLGHEAGWREATAAATICIAHGICYAKLKWCAWTCCPWRIYDSSETPL